MKCYHFFSVWVLLLFLSACTEEKELVIPQDVLDKEKMVEVMVQTQLAEATFYKKNSPKGDQKVKQYYLQVFQRQGISKEEFDRSFRFYKDHPEEMIEIYELVMNELSRLKAKEESKKEEKAD